VVLVPVPVIKNNLKWFWFQFLKIPVPVLERTKSWIWFQESDYPGPKLIVNCWLAPVLVPFFNCSFKNPGSGS